MKYSIIPKGYRLTVESWENDADNYRTKSMAGLSERDTRFLVDLISLMHSRNRRDDSARFGNMYDPNDSEIAAFTAAVQAVVAKHDLEGSQLVNHFETLVDPEGAFACVYDLLYELGLSGGSDYYTRVLNSYQVEYVPEDIKIEDVTDKFNTTLTE